MDIKGQRVQDGFGVNVERAKLDWSVPDITKLEFPATAAHTVGANRIDLIDAYTVGFS